MTLPEFRLETYFARWEFTARHHLTASDAQTMTISEVLALGTDEQRAAFDDLPLGYLPTWGTPELLAAIAAGYDAVAPEHVLTFADAEEAMFWALGDLVGPGDHAVVTVPNYQSAESLPIAAGAQVDGLLLRAEDGWSVDLEEFERLLRPETRLVAVNFPNNPTGAVPDRATYVRLVEICEERGIRLFSDEVYRGLETDPDRTLPAAADLSETAISLNVMSRPTGCPGCGSAGWPAVTAPCWNAWSGASTTRRSATRARASTWPRSRSARPTGSGPATGRSSPRTCRCSTRSSPPGPSTSRGSTRRAAASPTPG